MKFWTDTHYKIVLEAKIYESIKDPTYPYYNP